MPLRKRYDDSKSTRFSCVIGLYASWVFAIVSLVAGGIFLYLEHRNGDAASFHIPHLWREFLPLVFNVIITFLNDSMGYIHYVSLRWALQREGLLEFSSNLRLLTSSRLSKPNAWYSNLIYLAGIVLAYSSTSLIFLSFNPQLANVLGYGQNFQDYDNDSFHINSVALVFLGVGLIFQAAITHWALRTTKIPTWSSNPLDVVQACMHDPDSHKIYHRVGRCMMGVHMKYLSRRDVKPSKRQRPMFTAHRRVRYILTFLVSLPILGACWGGVVYLIIVKGDKHGVLGRSWSPLPSFTGITDKNCAASSCTDGSSILNIGWTASNGSVITALSILLFTAFQSIVTLALHCAELIVNLSRDEAIYRQLIEDRGTNGHYNSIVAAFTSWQTVLLFCFKAGAHWMFGLAINLSFKLGVNMYPPQIFYFALGAAMAATLGAALAFNRPRGYLPAAFGHIQTIADIIDEWAPSGSMLWGHKRSGIVVGEPSYAGTSTHELGPINPDAHYGGLTRLTPEQEAYQHGFMAGSGLNFMEPPHFEMTSRDPSPENYNQRGRSQHNHHGQRSFSSQSLAPLMQNQY